MSAHLRQSISPLTGLYRRLSTPLLLKSSDEPVWLKHYLREALTASMASEGGPCNLLKFAERPTSQGLSLSLFAFINADEVSGYIGGELYERSTSSALQLVFDFAAIHVMPAYRNMGVSLDMSFIMGEVLGHVVTAFISAHRDYAKPLEFVITGSPAEAELKSFEYLYERAERAALGSQCQVMLSVPE